jgi:hypothetical protein
LDFDEVLVLLGRVAITFSDRLAIWLLNSMSVPFVALIGRKMYVPSNALTCSWKLSHIFATGCGVSLLHQGRSFGMFMIPTTSLFHQYAAAWSPSTSVYARKQPGQRLNSSFVATIDLFQVVEFLVVVEFFWFSTLAITLTTAELFPTLSFMAAIVYISAEEAEILLPVNKYFLVVNYRGSCSKVMLT